MRVTQKMLATSALNGMQTNLRRLSNLQKQAVTTKRVSKPEDDPFAVEQSLGFRSQIKASETTRSNIGQSRDWLYTTDEALSDVSDLLTRSRSLALQGASDSMGVEERQSISIEINDILEEMLAVAGTRHGDDYIFSGFHVDQTPFTESRDPTTGRIASVAVNPTDITGQIVREVEPGVNMVVNVSGDSIFPNVFSTLIGLRDELDPTPPATFNLNAVTARLDELKVELDATLDVQASVGTKVRRLNSTTERMEASELGMRDLLSKAEDADMAEVVSDLTQQKYVYQTALAVNGQVLRTSLLDFIR